MIGQKQNSKLPQFVAHLALLAALTLCSLFFGFPASANNTSVPTQISSSIHPYAPSQFALADFDGDSHPDLATIEVGQGTPLSTQYWVAFQLSSGSRSAFAITAPTGGLQIASRDVNGDDFPDVIITTAWTNRPVAVLLNDGLGNFTQSSPSAFPYAFSNSDLFLSASSPLLRDTSLCFSWRYPSGQCDQVKILRPQNLSRLKPPENAKLAFQFASACFLGRAPPVPSVF